MRKKKQKTTAEIGFLGKAHIYLKHYGTSLCGITEERLFLVGLNLEQYQKPESMCQRCLNIWQRYQGGDNEIQSKD